MGTDTTDVVFQVSDETTNMPGTARLLTAGRGVTGIEKGREQSAYWVGTVAEARNAVQDNAKKRPDDPLLELVRGGIAGGVIAAVFGKIR